MQKLFFSLLVILLVQNSCTMERVGLRRRRIANMALREFNSPINNMNGVSPQSPVPLTQRISRGVRIIKHNIIYNQQLTLGFACLTSGVLLTAAAARTNNRILTFETLGQVCAPAQEAKDMCITFIIGAASACFGTFTCVDGCEALFDDCILGE